MKKYMLLLFATIYLCISCPADSLGEANNQILFHSGSEHFSFKIPTGWQQLSDTVLKARIIELESQRKTPLAQKPIFAFNRIGAVHPFAVPYLTISAGTLVINDAEIDKIVNSLPGAMGKALKQEDVNKLYKDAIIQRPIYDKAKHIATFATNSKLDNGVTSLDITLLTAFFFRKDGIVVMAFYLPLNESSTYIPIVKSVMNSFKFDKEYEYISR